MTGEQADKLLAHLSGLFPKWKPSAEEVALWKQRVMRFREPSIVRGAIDDHKARNPYNTPKMAPVLDKSRAAHEALAANDAARARASGETGRFDREARVGEVTAQLQSDRAGALRVYGDGGMAERHTREAARMAFVGLSNAGMSRTECYDAIQAALPQWDGWHEWAGEIEAAFAASDGLSRREMVDMALRLGREIEANRNAPPEKREPNHARLQRIRAAIDAAKTKGQDRQLGD